MKNTPMRKGTIRAPPKTEIVQEGRPGAQVDQVIVNQTPEAVAKEAIAKEEKVHKTEAEGVQSHQLAGEASQKKLNAYAVVQKTIKPSTVSCSRTSASPDVKTVDSTMRRSTATNTESAINLFPELDKLDKKGKSMKSKERIFIMWSWNQNQLFL